MSEKVRPYTKIKEVDEILHNAENQLTNDIGRYEAQRYIAVLADFIRPSVFIQIYEAGKKAATP